MPKNVNFAQNYVNILGVRILSTNTVKLLEKITEKILQKDKFLIFTPNSELVIMANSNNNLKSVVNSADFNVPDSIGLKYAARILDKVDLNIIPGRVLLTRLVELAEKNGWRVYFLGGEDNEAVMAAKKIKVLHPQLEIEHDKFIKLDKSGKPVSEVDNKVYLDAVSKINTFKPHLLFVAFGNPKQEFWLSDNIHKLDIVGGMAVGGTFRYLAGLSKLPPQWVSSFGLEWFWRLLTEPKRIGRIFNAVVLFPLRVLIVKLKHQ